WCKYRETVDYMVAVLGTEREYEGEEYVPYPVFPNSPGLLIWGSDMDGNNLYWFTEGDPDDWPIITRSRGDFENAWTRFDGPMTSFLAKAFTRQINLEFWPEFFEDS